MDELHPEADPVVVLLGAMDDDDVGMTETGEEPRFLEDARGLARRRLTLVQELERDLAMKARVEGPVDFTEAAFAHLLEQGERAPLADRTADSRQMARRRGRRGPSLFGRRGLPVAHRRPADLERVRLGWVRS